MAPPWNAPRSRCYRRPRSADIATLVLRSVANDDRVNFSAYCTACATTGTHGHCWHRSGSATASSSNTTTYGYSKRTGRNFAPSVHSTLRTSSVTWPASYSTTRVDDAARLEPADAPARPSELWLCYVYSICLQPRRASCRSFSFIHFSIEDLYKHCSPTAPFPLAAIILIRSHMPTPCFLKILLTSRS